MGKLHQETNEAIFNFIEKHKINVIESIEDISKIFNPDSLKSDKPEILSDSNAIIIFDDPNFNSAFLHEYFDTIIDNRKELSKVLSMPNGMPENLQQELYNKLQSKMDAIYPTIQIYYCNNPELNKQLFEPFFKNIFDAIVSQTSSKQEFEYDCPPVILTINKTANFIGIDYEKIAPMSLHSVFGQFIIIHDGEYIKESDKNKEESISEEK